ncbi:hypothetical protein AMK32_36265 [Streptomyces sp. CB01883]|nr:hypothetical protein AMK32_36265 [Streptomyces sp. CB01883]
MVRLTTLVIGLGTLQYPAGAPDVWGVTAVAVPAVKSDLTLPMVAVMELPPAWPVGAEAAMVPVAASVRVAAVASSLRPLFTL